MSGIPLTINDPLDFDSGRLFLKTTYDIWFYRVSVDGYWLILRFIRISQHCFELSSFFTISLYWGREEIWYEYSMVESYFIEKKIGGRLFNGFTDHRHCRGCWGIPDFQ